MTGLVIELQRDCLNKEAKVSNLLRKSLVISKKLGVIEIEEFLKKELNGYSKDDDIPEYRIIQGQVMMQTVYGGHFPVNFKSNELVENFSKRKNNQSICKLEFLLNSENEGLKMLFSQEVANKLTNSTTAGFNPYLLIDDIEIIGILEAVRNHILDWSLELEQQGILGKGMSFSNEEKAKAQHIHNHTVTNNIGNMSNSQLQQGSTDLTQSFNATTEQDNLKKVVEELKVFISTANLQKEQTEKIQESIATLEIQANSKKPKLAIIQESFESVKNISANVGGLIEIIRPFLS